MSSLPDSAGSNTRMKSLRNTMPNVSIQPHFPVIVDASVRDFKFALSQCFKWFAKSERDEIADRLSALWTTPTNGNYVVPTLCVRSGLDLFLQVKAFPPGSQVIMSAVNIPDMARIVESHGLDIVSLDINISTLEPKIELLPALVTSKTVAVLIAHLYGRWVNLEPIVSFCKSHKLALIEDCAECFIGFDRLGHPESDIALFSFGTIKFNTSFGGGIAKVKENVVFEAMCELQLKYPCQSSLTYLQKVLKVLLIFVTLQVHPVPDVCVQIFKKLDLDYKTKWVKMMRGFPQNMLQLIRYQPSSALLATMLHRHSNFNQNDIDLHIRKCDYFLSRLPNGYQKVGHRASGRHNSFWLFPVMVANRHMLVKYLNMVQVEAFHGATQLCLVEGINSKSGKKGDGFQQKNENCYPHEASYLIDHVIYLPVNKFVPYLELDKMLVACEVAVSLSRQSLHLQDGSNREKLLSKL